MDLRSYIELKEAYLNMMRPQQEEIAEQVEAAEETLSQEQLEALAEVLSEEQLDEFLRWGGYGGGTSQDMEDAKKALRQRRSERAATAAENQKKRNAERANSSSSSSGGNVFTRAQAALDKGKEEERRRDQEITDDARKLFGKKTTAEREAEDRSAGRASEVVNKDGNSVRYTRQSDGSTRRSGQQATLGGQQVRWKVDKTGKGSWRNAAGETVTGGSSSSSSSSSSSGGRGAKGSTQGSGNNGGNNRGTSTVTRTIQPSRDYEAEKKARESSSSGRRGRLSSQERRNARRSSSAAAQANTNSSGQNVKTTPPTSPSSSSSSSSSQRSSQPTSAPAKDRMAGASKADRMAAWAKANPKLAAAQKQREKTRGTSASSNPLMKGFAKKAPATSTPKPAATTKPAPTAGAQAAMKAAPLKPQSFGSALKGAAALKKLNNSVDMTEFDVIIEHLVEQGFPVEEALKLMVNMTEEKREQIIAERSREFTDMRKYDNASGARGPEFVKPAKAEIRNMQNASGARGPEFVGPAKAALGQKGETKVKKAGGKGPGTPMKEETVEEGMHREADTGKVVDKAEVGKTYYPNMPKKKSSVALRKEKEAAEKKKKTRKEENASLLDAYRSIYMSEEEADALRDKRQERGGVDGNTRYDKAPKGSTKKHGVPGAKTPAQAAMEKKYGKGASAMDVVRAELEKKYGKGAILGGKKKSDKKD